MAIDEIIGNIIKLHINLDKIFKLDNNTQLIIFALINELIDSLNCGTNKGLSLGGINYDIIRCNVLFNTLVENEYLITKRDANLNKILD